MYLPMMKRVRRKKRLGQRGGFLLSVLLRKRRRQRQRGGSLAKMMFPSLPSEKTVRNSLVALKHGSKLIGKAAKYLKGNPLKYLPKIGSAISAFQRGGIGINPRHSDYLHRRMGLRPYRFIKV